MSILSPVCADFSNFHEISLMQKKLKRKEGSNHKQIKKKKIYELINNLLN